MKHAVRIAIIFLLITSAFFEATIIQFPLIIILSFFLVFLFPDMVSALFIFLMSFFFDAVSGKIFGITSIIFFASLFFYYQEFLSFDVRNYKFMILFVILLSILYSVIVGYELNPVQFISFFGAISLLFYELESVRKSEKNF